jgi:hypothetical protein
MRGPWRTVIFSLGFLFASAAAEKRAEPVRYYVQLIWGTNREKPKTADYRPVGPKLRSELSRVFQWQRYWEVARREVSVQSGKPTRLRLSSECEVQIQFVSPTVSETLIYGKGMLVEKSRRKIECHGLAIHGGTTETGGSWFVVVRDDVPQAE